VAVGGALIGARLADEGTSDNSANAMLTNQKLTGLAADVIKLLERNYILMCGNLENAVRRGVNDELACFNMLVTVVANNVCAGVGLVAKNSATDSFAEPI
jgi:hypothetical protein